MLSGTNRTEGAAVRLPAVCVAVAVWAAWVSTALANGAIPGALLDRAAGGAPVRVIVQLAGSPPSESEVGDDAVARARRRQAIARSQARVATALRSTAHRVTHEYQSIPFMAVEAAADALDVLAHSSEIVAVFEDVPVPPALLFSVPLVQGNLAWAAGYDGSGWSVAILDTGVDSTHPFLAGRVVAEACFSANGNCPNSGTSQTGAGAGAPCNYSNDCAHGTHVAGIAAGSGSNFSGVAKAANIIAVQVFSRFDSQVVCGSRPAPCALSWSSDQIAGLDFVYNLRSTYDIASANMSLGGGAYSSQAACDADNAPIKAAIDSLRAAGIATAIAAGNDGFLGMLSSPGCVSSAISVGCTSTFGGICNFSNRASFLSLWAPGAAIYSSVLGGAFALFSGTSMSTPHVAGAWALLKDYAPGASVSSILSALQTTGVAIPYPSNASQIRIWYAARLLLCGDGTLDAREACDDGDLDDGDGCESDCTLTPCSTPVGAVKLGVSKLDAPGNQKLSFKGSITVSHPFVPVLNPASNGVRLQILDADRQIVAAANVPAGAYDMVTRQGWKTNRAGTKWTYFDPSSLQGISKIIVQDKSARTPGLIAFKIVGKNATLPIAALPLTAEVYFDAAIPTAAQCAHAAPACAFNRASTAVKCE